MQRLRVSGIMQFSSGSTIGGATLAGFDLPTAQRSSTRRANSTRSRSRPSLTSATRSSLRRSGDPARRDAGEDQRRSGAGRTREDTERVHLVPARPSCSRSAGIALFVGSFVIANSLSITIAQRTRELATLRMLGASRRQVLRSIILEALVVGVVASVIGLFLGLLLAKGLFWLFDQVGFTLPNTGLVFETRTAIISLAAGILVTLVASLRPARRATRVPADRRRARGLDPSSRDGSLGSAVRVPSLLMAARVRRARVRDLRRRSRDDAGADLDGPRHAPRLPRGRPLLVAPRAPARRCPRLAGNADRRRRRRARSRQRPPEPAAHGVDRRGAHDRARARDARRDACVRDHRLVQWRGERPLHRRLRDHRAEQLLADPDRRRRGRRARRRA